MSESANADWLTKALWWLFALYGMFACAVLGRYFYLSTGWSANRKDWLDFAGVLADLFGPMLALAAAALVLKTLQKQQEQLDVQRTHIVDLKRSEDRVLTPKLLTVNVDVNEKYAHPDARICVVALFDQSAEWMTCAQSPGSTPIAIRSYSRDREARLFLWPTTVENSYAAHVTFERRNGSRAQAWFFFSNGPGPNSRSWTLEVIEPQTTTPP